MQNSHMLLTIIALGCFMAAGCSTDKAKETPPELVQSDGHTGGAAAKFSNYFLDKSAYADFKVTLPEPPKANSALFKNDIEIYKNTRKYRNSSLWEEARKFADYSPDNMCRYFQEAAGTKLSKEKTPWTYYLIGKLSGDAISGGTRPAKKFYQRTRPFVYFKERTCSTKEDDDAHVKSGSYPSGHTAYGELVGLVLAELLPQKQNEIISAAHQYGYYRIICGFHWASDIEAGRKAAAYVFARLHADKEFLRVMDMARAELSKN